jgi:thiamine transport system permease protein
LYSFFTVFIFSFLSFTTPLLLCGRYPTLELLVYIYATSLPLRTSLPASCCWAYSPRLCSLLPSSGSRSPRLRGPPRGPPPWGPSPRRFPSE